MKNLLQHNPLDWQPLYKLKVKRCPVCGHKDNCSGSRDESGEVNLIYCRRPSENQTGLVGKPGKNGGATFVLNPRQPAVDCRPAQRPRPTPQPEHYRADPDHIDGVYATLLVGHLCLRDGHRMKLALRGFDDTEINRLNLKSTPSRSECDSIADALSKYDLRGVPGFYREGRSWRLRDLGSGILIAVRDARHRIRGLQLRRDEGEPRYIWLSSPPDKFTDGASSGAPAHFARPQRVAVTNEVVITEGAMKANVVSFFLNTPVVGVAGVSTFTDDFGEYLKRELPDLRRAVICYDTDWQSKKEVRRALLRLQRTLTKAGLRWKVRTWPPEFKGYDDYLAATVMREEVPA